MDAYTRKQRREYMRKYMRELKQWAVDKLGRRCIDCGLISQYDCVYDFHHEGEDSWKRDSTAKAYQLLLWKKLDKIPDDIKLICSNCHRIRTVNENEKI